MCDICGSTNTIIKNHDHIYKIKGKEIKFNLDRRFCVSCGNLVYDDVLDNKASEKAIEIYNELYGIDKTQIINLRKSFNLSQELFSKIIGCAKKTLISYEKGTSIPNDCYLIILRSLLINPSLIFTFIDANKSQFTDREYNRINNKISKFLENNEKQLILGEESNLTEYNGYTKLNKEKVYNMISYLADKTILKTKLLKEMFYADFLFYKEHGRSLTGLEYCKLPFGPVPDKFDTILFKCYNDEVIDYEFEFNSFRECYLITSRKKIDKDLFTEEELKILNKVKKYFNKYTVGDIVNYSHKEKAFTDTNKCEKISYDYAFDIDLK